MSSTVYILLFRGVGGATRLPVKALKQALTEAGFDKALGASDAARNWNALLKLPQLAEAAA